MQAVIDAATLYGASRFLRRVHDDPNYEFRDRFTIAQDRLLFVEFLHILLLYEDVILDNSSIDIDRQSGTDPFWSRNAPLRAELRPLVESVQVTGGPSFVERDLCFLSESDHSLIQEFIVDQLARSVNRRDAEMVAVPWAYNKTHNDYGAFAYYCDRAGIPELIPLAIFLYRGLVYAGFAQPANAIYLAAPGRLRALDVFLSDMDKHRFDYPRRGYGDLISILKLPNNGFDFAYLSNSGSGAHELSAVTRYMRNMAAEEAIETALKLRNSSDGRALRDAWARRVENSGGMVGMEQIEVTQNIDNSIVSGNIVQSVSITPTYILARPRW